MLYFIIAFDINRLLLQNYCRLVGTASVPIVSQSYLFCVGITSGSLCVDIRQVDSRDDRHYYIIDMLYKTRVREYMC